MIGIRVDPTNHIFVVHSNGLQGSRLRTKVLEAFSALDTNKSGGIDAAEFKDYMQNVCGAFYLFRFFYRCSVVALFWFVLGALYEAAGHQMRIDTVCRGSVEVRTFPFSSVWIQRG